MEPEPPPPPPAKRTFSGSDGVFLALAVVLLLVIGAALAWAFLGNRGGKPQGEPPGSNGVTKRPSTALVGSPGGAACGPVQPVPAFDQEPGDQAHDEVRLSRYPSVPPASGPHASRTLPPGAYATAPPVGSVIHSLEHGAVVIWFEPSLVSSPSVQNLARFMSPSGPGGGVHLILAPYDYPGEDQAGRLPSGVRAAMVAWHRIQYCNRLDAATITAAGDFIRRFRCAPGCDPDAYDGEAPEAGLEI